MKKKKTDKEMRELALQCIEANKVEDANALMQIMSTLSLEEMFALDALIEEMHLIDN